MTLKKTFSLPPFTYLDSSDAQAIAWMILNCFLFAIMTAMIRHTSETISPFMIVLFRQFGALLVMIPWCLKHKQQVFKTERHKGIHFVRALVGIAAMELWYYSITILPLPDAVSLSFTTPLFTILAAILFLNEKVNRYKWLGLFIGFIGTLVILRPGTAVFAPEATLVLLTAIGWAASNTLIKFLSHKDSPQTIVFFMTLFMLPLSLPFAVIAWQTPDLSQILWMLAIGIISQLSFICLSHAIEKADIATVLPFDFTKLIFISIVAYFFFNETADLWVIVGSGIIISGAVYANKRLSSRDEISPATRL